MDKRDEFSEPVKRALALRAGYRCAFPGCDRLTVGPSDDSPLAVSNVGVAAHIRAAAPGGKRYESSMTSEARKDIGNGIWMCQFHGTLIDRDEATYPVELLHAWQRDHEDRMKAELQSHTRGTGLTTPGLLVLGPDIIAVGELVGMDGSRWELRLAHFAVGDLTSLIDFCERFDELPAIERYVLVEAIGDGRVLAEAPTWKKADSGYTLFIDVMPPFSRVRAQDLGADIELGPDGDLSIRNGNLGIVRGLDALPQKVQLALSTRKGEIAWAPTIGSRLAEFFYLYAGSPWFDRLVKTEVIRLSSIPVRDAASEEPRTHLECVERVVSVRLLAPHPVNSRIPVEVVLDIKGVGLWTATLRLFVKELSGSTNSTVSGAP